MSDKPLLVGELNPYGANPYYALYHLPRGASGNRLRCIMGLTDIEYDRLLAKTNLCAGEWKLGRASENLASLILARSGGRLVLLGSRVLAAARRLARKSEGWQGELEFFHAATAPSLGGGRTTLVFLPHPSGRNRAWNEPGSVTRARRLLAEVAPEIAWGSCACELPAARRPPSPCVGVGDLPAEETRLAPDESGKEDHDE